MRLLFSHLSSLVIITGVTGAGKSSALRTFEDLGYYCVDNLPVALLRSYLKFSRKDSDRMRKSCLLVDIDSEEKISRLLKYLEPEGGLPDNFHLIYLDSHNSTIIKRYSETRRPHHGFNPEIDKNLSSAIDRNREILHPIKKISGISIDTTSMTVHDLRRKLTEFAANALEENIKVTRINFHSFGFKHGVPNDCDLVVDVRFLPNPYFVDTLKEKTGLDKEVSDYVLNNELTSQFLEKYQKLLEFLIPQYIHEGKYYINIGIGCTGGKHRSVAISEYLSKNIILEECKDNKVIVSCSHRDTHK